MKKIQGVSAILIAFLLNISAAIAKEPFDYQLGFQPAGSPSMVEIVSFHNMMLWIIAGITAFVTLLLVYVILRFNKRTNPKPAEFTHNVLIEVIWTIIPVIILIIIIIPSLRLLYFTDRVQEPEMTLKVTGYQWYWGYEYPDHGGINFLSYMIPDDEINLDEGQRRLLSTDNAIVLPIDTDIQILVTSADVLHSFAMPALGLKTDAVPGRTNETWVRITEPGTYFGQCSELCGKDHAYMPIEIKAVSKEEFEAWVETAKEEFASLDTPISYNKNAFDYAYLNIENK